MHKSIFAHLLWMLNLWQVGAQTINITGPAGSGQFGNTLTVLPNGNYVVTDPLYDDGGIADVGAVYLYNGSTHALISTLKGSTANDKIGAGYNGVIALSNSNFIVRSPYWDNGVVSDAGAVTWGSGTTGVSGIVTNNNSLVGSSANDQVGVNVVTALSNGNYVILSPFWDNNFLTNAGAATWGNGTTGVSGIITSGNSLVGSTTGVGVGGGITALSNGNYVVVSSNNGAGAVTWGNGTTGISGIVSSSNSLVGSSSTDHVGGGFPGLSNGIIVLNNNNYVVLSPEWDNNGSTDAGAVTWGSGTMGVSGILSSSNSLVGDLVNDRVGLNVTPLSNGNYVVSSPFWYSPVRRVGAVTWCNGAISKTGIVRSSNSLVGSTAEDGIGNVTALSNGNYLVQSSIWDNGTAIDAGAVTWGNGTIGVSGVISSNNSFVGSTAYARVGSSVTVLNNGNYVVSAGSVVWANGATGLTGSANDLNSSNSLVVGGGGPSYVTALSNGNYVVRSPFWDNGAEIDAGAVTWGNGTTGITGIVSVSNSLIGNKANDNVGGSEVLGVGTALSNGNYVVSSPSWDNGVIVDAGAVTWGDGTTGTTGIVCSSNSLVGSTANARVGAITALSNGNYVVVSMYGMATDAWSAAWGNGTTGTAGIVSSSNSLICSAANETDYRIAVIPLSNGNYVLAGGYWNNQGANRAGAVTWGSGTQGITGVVSSNNSLVGNASYDLVGYEGNVTPLSNGNYVVVSANWDNGSVIDAGAITLGQGASAVSGNITSCNSVIGATAAGGNSLNFVYDNSYDYLIVGRPSENIVSIYRPSDMEQAATLDSTSVNITGNSPTALVANSGCRIIATLTPNGANPVNGTVTAKTWIENTVPTENGEPYVARHYEITPVTNASTATSKVTLYFTQQEFNDFNTQTGSVWDLPTGEGDAAGKANVRIGKYAGTSSDGSGLPATYPGSAVMIDPGDGDIVWNNSLNRWEISFDVTGFSGFTLQTHSPALPLTLLEFNARLVNNNGLLSWKTTDEVNTLSFDIERSIDGRNYAAIANVPAVNAAGVHQYGYTDTNVLSLGMPVIHYRLKQKDIDGRFVYSRIVTLFSDDSKNSVLFYPNPVDREIDLIITVSVPEKLQARVIDNVGRVMRQWQLSVGAGSTSLSLNADRLANGIYYLELKGKKINETIRFVKQ